MKLTKQDLELILESLKYTKLKFEDYEKYPSYEYKQERINEVNEVVGKIEALKRELPNDAI